MSWKNSAWMLVFGLSYSLLTSTFPTSADVLKILGRCTFDTAGEDIPQGPDHDILDLKVLSNFDRSDVYQMTLRNQKTGEVRTVAMKTVIGDAKAMVDQDKLVALLAPLYQGPRANLLNRVLSTRMKCSGEGIKFQSPTQGMIMSEVVDGSMDLATTERLRLDPELAKKDPELFRARLATLRKIQDQASAAIETLRQSHLVHTDIRPENILFKLSEGFDWNRPDPNRISFQLGNLDFTRRERNLTHGYTPSYTPPEVKRLKIANSAHDVYGLSSSLAETLFGKNLERGPNNAEDLAEFSAFVRQQFDAFSSLQASDPEIYQELMLLRDGILEGMEADPKARLAKFVERAKRLAEIPEPPFDCSIPFETFLRGLRR